MFVSRLLKKITALNWAIIVITLIYGYTASNLGHWKREGRIIVSDVIWHYEFLPAHFIYGDVTFEHPNENINKYKTVFYKFDAPIAGKKYIKTSMGLAMLYAPFFGIAHVHANVTGAEPSGYSPPYKFWLVWGSVIYFLLGMIFISKLLLRYFSTKAVTLTLICLGLGTNLYYYTILAVGMPHVYVFSLFSIVLFLVDSWYRNFKPQNILLAAILVSILILIRPIFILFLPLLLLWNLENTSLISRLNVLKNHWLQIVISIVAAFLVWVPQFLYWKTVSGSYVFYPYVGETFFFTDPHIWDCLFGFRKGWFIYTPIMLFATIGIVYSLKKYKNLSLVIFISAFLYFYVCTCWWVWWFGGSFGWRPMIDIYPLMAFGFAAIFQFLLGKRLWVKWVFSLIGVCFILLNFAYTRQSHEGNLHHDAMSQDAYFYLFMKFKGQVDHEKLESLYSIPDYDRALKGDRDQ